MSNTPTSDDSAEALAQAPLAIARQSILDKERDVFGYELFDRSRAATAHTPASDAALLFNVLSSTDCEALLDRITIFITCTHQTLPGGHLELFQPDRVVLEVPPLPQATAEEVEVYLAILTDVRQRGFRLAFDDTMLTAAYASWLPLAAFIKINISKRTADEVRAATQLAKNFPNAQLIAEKVETVAQFQLAVSLGFGLFQGYWFAKPVLVTGQTVRPAQGNIISLINLSRKQASTSEIEDVFKRDPTLSFNLLRFINSAGFGLRCEITSFRQAIMMIGLKKLFRWAALLMTTSRAAGVPSAVANMAVVRGRLMELLATELLPPEECDNAFVVGVFSMLDTMLGMPMKKALESISLPPSVTSALLHEEGTLGPFLSLTKACENVDDAAFAKYAEALHLSNHQVNWAHLQALAWSETMGE